MWTDFGLFVQLLAGNTKTPHRGGPPKSAWWRCLLLEYLMPKNLIGKFSYSIKAILLTAGVLPLAGCATRVYTPGGEVICYSQNCVQEMQAWTRDDYLSRQYEQKYGNQVESRSQEPKAPVAPPPRYRKPKPTPVTCPPDMIPAPPPDYGCVYPRR